ncbi:hypothetical protein IAT38_002891 [Cryptococcus sp. DSM 104549]
MAKKKLSLKPVQRGFATTSVANKKPPPQKEEPVQESKEDAPAAGEPSVEGASPAPAENGDAAPDKLADWEDDAALEKEALQALVDKLHDKGEKEVARVIKAIEFDRRLAASFPKLQVDESLRDRVLELALEEERAALEDPSRPPTRTIPATSSPSETEKGYLRFFVAYHVLQALGFRQERIEQCMLEGLKEGGGWEEALEWMWMHLSEEECLQQGEYAKREEPSIIEPQESLMDLEVPAEPEPAPEPAPVPAKDTSSSSTPAAPTSLFQSQNASDSDSDSSDSDSDAGAYQANEAWAKLMLELDNLRIAAGAGAGGGGGKKGKKGKGTGVVLETPAMRRLKEKIGKVEKEYLFARKDADAILKVLKSQRDASAIAAKFKGLSTQASSAPSSPPAEVEAPPAPTPPSAAEPPDVLAGSDSDADSDSGGLFGGMLDEPAPPPPSSLGDDTATPASGNTSIKVRSMPIPKQLSFAGTIPKNILKAALVKSGKQAVIAYARLSGGSRAARAALEIRWSAGPSGGARRVWKMEDIACDDLSEAENYVSTIALHSLDAEGVLSGVNWRTMPPAYRELWEELRVERKEREDGVKRGVWGMVKGLWERKAVEKVEGKEGRGEARAGEGRGEARAGEGKGPAGTGAGKQDAQAEGKPDVFSAKLQADFERRRQTSAYQSMLHQRSTLPIASFRTQITSTLASHQVMVLSGETGCGKSTQLPSFILEDQLAQGRPCKIFVTEPRRISAISLAQRVSQELGDPRGAVGSERSLVGYSIRLESKVSRETRLAFVTNGIALRMLESGSSGGGGGGRGGTAFDEVTHIIVDEVHERSIESDFLLIVLKNLCLQRPDLKVVLMSATVDADKISAFFGGCPCLSVPGRTFPVQVNYLEDAVEASGWVCDEGSAYAVRGKGFKPKNQLVEWNEEGAKSDSDPEDEDVDDSTKTHPAKLSSTKYSAATVSTVNLLDSRQIPYPLIIKLLERICFADPDLMQFSAATLVFMPGLAEIRKLHDMLLAHPDFGGRGFVVWPLHSSVSSEGQSAVFETPPEGVRKIVIATNIAETGVTIPDITCVIDSGKHREMRYDEKRQLSRFIESYIARSNAKQRRGRAGRVQPGLAFHLFTKARHDTQLAEHPIPEMLRLSLQDLALRIKILKVPLGKTVESVLLQALDPPSAINVQRAVAALVEVKALTPGEEITPLGRLLSKLPMDVHLGKFLLVAAMLGCLDPALTIAATLNSKSPFVTPFGFETQARAAKAGFAVGKSDFLTIANVFASWRSASDNPNFVRVFCKKNFVSQQNLQQIEELRQQLLAYLVDSSFVEATPAQRQTISQARFSRGVRTRFVPVPPELNVNGDKVKVLEAALASGLYPKLLALDNAGGGGGAGGMKTLINQQPVAIHPSSVNFKLPRSEFGTNYLAYFTIMHSKRLYAWETGPVDDTALVLLCGDIADFRISASSFILDRKIKYHLPPKTALALKLVREQLALAWAMRFRGKKLSEGQQKWFDLGMECLTFVPGEEEASVGVV